MLNIAVMRSASYTLCALLICAIGGSSCVSDEDQISEFKAAIPTKAELRVSFPSTKLDPETIGPVGPFKVGTLGEEAHFYRFTVWALTELNAGIATVLNSTDKTAMRHAEISVTENEVRWTWTGPKSEWLLIVKRASANKFEYLTASRLIGDTGPHRLRLGGTRFIGSTPESSNGSFWIDLNNDIPAHTQGKVFVIYRIDAEETDLTVYYYNYKIRKSGLPVTAAYHVNTNADASGFKAARSNGFNVFGGDPQVKEVMLIRLQWTSTGSGRGDGFAFGGDIPPTGFRQIDINECWTDDATHGLIFTTQVRLPHGNKPPLIFDEQGDPSACPSFDDPYPIVPGEIAPPENGPWLERFGIGGSQ